MRSIAALHGFRRRALRLRTRIGFSLAAQIAALAGVLAIVVSFAAFAGVTEDVTQHNGLATRDGSNLHYFLVDRHSAIVQLARRFTEAGAVPVLMLVAIATAWLLWRRGTRLALVLAPLTALVIAAITVGVTKHIVNRMRPPAALHLVSERDASFPSGHATDATAVYLTIALIGAVFVLRRPLARVLAVGGAAGLAAVIGASRLVLGVHWPTDVLAGWALGTTVAIAVTLTMSVLGGMTLPSSDRSQGPIRRGSTRVVTWLLLERSSDRARLRAA